MPRHPTGTTWPFVVAFLAGVGGVTVVLAGVITIERLGVAVFTVAFFAGRWGLPAWSLWLAGGLGVAGAVMLWLTNGAEQRRLGGSTARRHDGGMTGSLGGWHRAPGTEHPARSTQHPETR